VSDSNEVRILTRHIFLLAVLSLLGVCPGCGWLIEQDARKIVEPAAMPGRLMLKMTGGNNRLVDQGRITKSGFVEAADGTKLSYWVLRHRKVSVAATTADQSRGTVVLIHPLMASKWWFLSLGQELSDRGYDVVMPDLRAHGESGGKYITWGAKEKDDIKRIMDDLIGDKVVSRRIYAMGASLGGCVAVQYAAYDKRCRGVVSICPPVGAREVARRILPLPSQADLDQRIAWAGNLAGFDPSQASAAKSARKLNCPIILIHGLLDVVVPTEHSEVILEAAPEPKKLIILNWADHMTVQVGQDEYLADQLDAVTKMGRG
jgi:uncharacterized protein